MSANEAINELTKSVHQHTDTTQNFLNEADSRIATKEKQVDDKIAEMDSTFAPSKNKGWLDLEVGGDSDKWYPITLSNLRHSKTIIDRPVHTQSDLYGSSNGALAFEMVANDSNWGNDVGYVTVNHYLEMSRKGAQFIGFVTLGLTKGIIYLRGATNYRYWNSVGIIPEIHLETTVITGGVEISPLTEVNSSMKPVGYRRGES